MQGRILVVKRDPDQRSAEKQDGNQHEPVGRTQRIWVDIRHEKVDEKWGGEAESPHGDALDEKKPIFHEPENTCLQD